MKGSQSQKTKGSRIPKHKEGFFSPEVSNQNCWTQISADKSQVMAKRTYKHARGSLNVENYDNVVLIRFDWAPEKASLNLTPKSRISKFGNTA